MVFLSPLFTGSIGITMSIAGPVKRVFSVKYDVWKDGLTFYNWDYGLILPIYNLKPVIAVLEVKISGKECYTKMNPNPNVKYPIEGNQKSSIL